MKTGYAKNIMSRSVYLVHLSKVLAATGLISIFIWSGLSAHAALKTRGKGKTIALVAAQFPPEVQPGLKSFSNKCSKCHSLGRPISALKTGRTPISGGTFNDQYIKKYVVKMMRKPNSGITKSDAKEIIGFLRFAKNVAQ